MSISGEMATKGGRRTYWFGYAQDEFKVSRTLTLSLGVRYEFYSVMKEVKDRILVFDTAKGDFAPQGTPAYNPDRDNIAPRFSFAWAPDRFKQKTVFRGGYGMYYGPGQFDDVMASIESTQETFRLTSADVPGLSYPIDPFLSQAKAQGLTPRHIMPDRRDMYSQHWGFSIQQSAALRVSPCRWATSGTTPTRSCRAPTSTSSTRLPACARGLQVRPNRQQGRRRQRQLQRPAGVGEAAV